MLAARTVHYGVSLDQFIEGDSRVHQVLTSTSRENRGDNDAPMVRLRFLVLRRDRGLQARKKLDLTINNPDVIKTEDIRY